MDYFKIFGCLVYEHAVDEKRKKLNDKFEKCIFVGVSNHSKAYKLYDPRSKKIVISHGEQPHEELEEEAMIEELEEAMIESSNPIIERHL
ncbi:hypothetical protein CR513_36148, partial [Mucuna pruriens]